MDLTFAVALPALLVLTTSAAGWWWPLGRQYDVKLTAFDQLARPGETVVVRAKLEHQGVLGVNPDLRGYPLRIAVGPLVDQEVRTGRDGVAALEITVPAEAKAQYPIQVAFAGSMEGHRARKGVMLTTSSFSREAHDYVQRIERKIVLIDGQRLAQLMIEHDVGVATARSYVVKKLDLDYFEEAGS